MLSRFWLTVFSPHQGYPRLVQYLLQVQGLCQNWRWNPRKEVFTGADKVDRLGEGGVDQQVDDQHGEGGDDQHGERGDGQHGEGGGMAGWQQWDGATILMMNYSDQEKGTSRYADCRVLILTLSSFF